MISISRFLLVILFVLTMLFIKVRDKLIVVDQAEAKNIEVSDNTKFITLKNNKVLKLNLKDFLSRP